MTNNSQFNAMKQQIRDGRLIAIFATGITALFVCIYGSICTFFYGIRPGPSFIEELQSGHIKQTDVVQFEILHFNASWGWPFRESDYSKLDRIDFTNRNDIKELLSILNTNSTPGITPRNHPGTISWGIFRIDLRADAHFYLYYQAQKDWELGYYFASINANSANSTNPNGAKPYESIAIADFLRRKDPWFDNRAIIQPAPKGYGW
jgi:hypothetical protein